MGKIVAWITKIVNQAMKSITIDIKQELMELKLAIKEQDKKIDQNEKDRIRYEILDFANSCHNGRNHTRDEFEHIIALNDKYKILLERTHDENGVFNIEYKYIDKLYSEKKENKTFLAEELQYQQEGNTKDE
jgi:hypothetical protein